MTDDLVKRLREGDHFEKVMSAGQAADRIEELEAKLAEAVQNTLDAASTYMKTQYDIGALSQPVDRMRVLQILKEKTYA